MNKQTNRLDYYDFEAIVENARMQRSVAVGDAIAGLLALMFNGLDRAVAAVKSGVSGSKSHAAAHAGSGLDVPAHR